MFLHVFVILFTGARVVSQHALQVVSQHALQQVSRGGEGGRCGIPTCLAGFQAHTQGVDEGYGQGGLQAHTKGGSPGPHQGGGVSQNVLRQTPTDG